MNEYLLNFEIYYMIALDGYGGDPKCRLWAHFQLNFWHPWRRTAVSASINTGCARISLRHESIQISRFDSMHPPAIASKSIASPAAFFPTVAAIGLFCLWLLQQQHDPISS